MSQDPAKTLNRRDFLRLACQAVAATAAAAALPLPAWGSGLQPYVGQIAVVPFTFAPNGWLFCEGQELPISENEVLFQLIGTTFGGDGESTFALPDCRANPNSWEGFHRGFEYQPLKYAISLFGVFPAPTYGSPDGWYLGQIALFPFNFVPNGWAACNGQLMPINQNQALYSLLGTMYGGTGQTTFALPNLRYPDGRPGHRHTPAQPGTEASWIYAIALSGIYPDRDAGSTADTPFVGELSIFPYNFVPGGYTECRGQLLPLSQNTALFSLLGTNFGGDGKSNFALPDTTWTTSGDQGALHRGFEGTAIRYAIARSGIFPSRP
jgi:microcystin-dependent protein